jgi:hypothetical protein
MLSRLLRRNRFELSPANVDATWLDGDGWRGWPPPRNVLVGESHYRPALRRLTGKPRQAGYLIPVAVTFVREPHNQYDRNAFRAEVQGQHVGYLDREVAAQLAATADAGRCISFTVCGVIRGGSLKAKDVGVHVWLERRLSPGVDIGFADDRWTIETWPPSPTEGVYCSADDAAG